MGEASRRGTFTERKTKAVIRNKEKIVVAMENLKKQEASLTPEQRKSRTRARLSMLSFMAIWKQSGLSSKESKRSLKRHNKKGV